MVSAPGHLLRLSATNPILTLLKEGLPHVERKSEDASELQVSLEASLRRACSAWVAAVVAKSRRAAAGATGSAGDGSNKVESVLNEVAECVDVLSLWLPEPSMQRVLLRAMSSALTADDALPAGSTRSSAGGEGEGDELEQLRAGLERIEKLVCDPREASFLARWEALAGSGMQARSES